MDARARFLHPPSQQLVGWRVATVTREDIHVYDKWSRCTAAREQQAVYPCQIFAFIRTSPALQAIGKGVLWEPRLRFCKYS